MIFRATYNSPIGEITILTNEIHVLFLGFTNQKFFDSAMKKISDNGNLIDCPNAASGVENSISHLPSDGETPAPLAGTFRWLDVFITIIEVKNECKFNRKFCFGF